MCKHFHLFNSKTVQPCLTTFYFGRIGGGANKRPVSLSTVKLNLLGAAFFALLFFGGTGKVNGQLCIAPTSCYNLVINVTPVVSPDPCMTPECNRFYFQVSLTLNSFSPPGNPGSFNLCYEEFGFTMALATDPADGASSINQGGTEACLSPTFPVGTLGFDGANIVTFYTQCSPGGLCPPITFTRVGFRYTANLFILAVDAVPGEVLTFDPIQSYYTNPPTLYCTDNLIFNSDPFTVPAIGVTETDVCLSFGDFDDMTELLPVKAANTAALPSDITYLAFTFTIEADNIMEVPVLKNFIQVPAEQRIDPIPGTNDWKGFVKFVSTPGIMVPAQGESKLFDIEIKGPVNQSFMASADVCFGPGQIRNGAGCKDACLSTDCAEIIFDGDEPCNPDYFSVVVEAEPLSVTCTELGAKATLNWHNLPPTLDFDRIQIGLEFDLPAGVSITGIGANTFGCPSNPVCNPDGGFTNCFKIDGNRVTFCFFPVTAQPVSLGSYFTVNFNAPTNCINGVTVIESMVDVATNPPGGDGCVAEAFVSPTDFPLCTPLLAGWVKNTNGMDIDDVDVVINRTMPLAGCNPITIWPNNAPWSWCPCDLGLYRVKPQVKFGGDAWLNGVTTWDLVLISKHISATEPFTSLYQYIAADASNNRIIDPPVSQGALPLDISELRKLILGIYQALPGNSSWRYVDAYDPPNLPMDPFTPFDMPAEEWLGHPSDPTIDFIAIKVGDVNNTHNADIQQRPAGKLSLLTEAISQAYAGDLVSIPVRYGGDAPLTALQMGLRFDANLWEYVGITSSEVLQVSEDCFNLTNTADGEIRFVWFSANPEEYVRPGQALFYLTFRAKRAVKSDPMPLQIDDDLLRSIAFNQEGAFYSLSMGGQAAVRRSDLPLNKDFAVICAPNPTSGAATLNITTVTEATTATVWAYNAYGSRLMRREIPLTGQSTYFQIPESANWPAGMYVWKVKVGDVKTEGRLLKQ
ncbi:MAG: cohesin domain-containing protein [Saprospiraceae bacterium]